MKLALLLAVALQLTAATTRVLILTAPDPEHDRRATSEVLRRILEGAGRFRVGMSDEMLHPSQMKEWDVVVVNGSLVVTAAAKPIVMVHVAAPPGGVRNAIQEVRASPARHPVTAGLPDTFPVTDSLHRSSGTRAQWQTIASIGEQPVASIGEENGARRGMLALGHDAAAMHSPLFAPLFARMVEWAATGAVTLPADVRVHPQNADAVRAYIVIGGHDHEPSFYSLFENEPRIRGMVETHPAALRRDKLTERYDVIVMHDMWNDLDDKGRENLRNWVEAGKGVVVTHHALAGNWQWEWWWKEVVGGRYLLKPDAGMPGSTYKHDQFLKVTPVPGHPVVDGVSPMLLHDETYKSMWISSEARPLLKTDHPDSDPVIAWISPYKKARIVVIQPGHDRTTHLDPSYRRLIHNAIFWAAGRLNEPSLRR